MYVYLESLSLNVFAFLILWRKKIRKCCGWFRERKKKRQKNIFDSSSPKIKKFLEFGIF